MSLETVRQNLFDGWSLRCSGPRNVGATGDGVGAVEKKVAAEKRGKGGQRSGASVQTPISTPKPIPNKQRGRKQIKVYNGSTLARPEKKFYGEVTGKPSPNATHWVSTGGKRKQETRRLITCK